MVCKAGHIIIVADAFGCVMLYVMKTMQEPQSDHRELAITAIGIIVISLLIMYLGRSSLQEKPYVPNEHQRAAAEEVTIRK